MDTKVVPLESRRPGKRVAHTYHIKINSRYMQKILQNHRGKASALWCRQFTDELWSPEFSRLSVAEYGAFRRILMMFCRSKTAIQENLIVVTAKELKMHGITLRVLRKLCTNLGQLEISLLTESGQIKDLEDD